MLIHTATHDTHEFFIGDRWWRTVCPSSSIGTSFRSEGYSGGSKNHMTITPKSQKRRDELDDLLDFIMDMLPEQCRIGSMGARDGLKRFAKAYDDLLTENHLLRHGHKDSDLLAVVKLAYRKHHLGSLDVGWEELSTRLCDALCNAMGDEEFQRWLAFPAKDARAGGS